MTDLTLIRAFIGADMRNCLGIGIKMHLLTHQRASSNDLADYFDVDFKAIQEALGNLKRGGWVEIVDYEFSHGLSMNSQTGTLAKTNRKCGVYAASDKLKRVV